MSPVFDALRFNQSNVFKAQLDDVVNVSLAIGCELDADHKSRAFRIGNSSAGT